MADGILKVGTITTSSGSGTITLGQSNETVALGSGATATGFGETNTPYFQAYRAGSWTKIQINTEVVDSANAYDNSSNYRFTPQTAGKYYIYGQMTTSSSTNMARVMSAIYLNGSAVSQTNTYNDDSSSAHTATIVTLNGSSDYVELYGFLTSGGNTDLQNRGTFFGGFLISTT